MAAAVVLLGAWSAARAVTYYLAVDVPSRLGGADYTAYRIVRSDDAVYSLEQSLPAGAVLSSLHRRADGVWLVSLARSASFGASPIYETRDILSYDGAAFAIYLDGSTAGIPDYARIDALFQRPAGGLVLSFDVPVRIGGAEYGPSDLVLYMLGFSRYFSASAAGVPAGSNLVGAGLDSSGALVVTFDVPTRLGGADYMPGQLVRWTGSSWASYFADPAWPASSQLRDFAFVPGAGTVPDGSGAGETPLTVTLSPAGARITLAWGRSCLASDSDYEVYEGILGDWASHVPRACSTSGALSVELTPGDGGRYYLVVPRNGVMEGSYGRASNGVERPAGAAVCLPQAIDTTCHE